MKGNNNLFVMLSFSENRYIIVAFDAQFVPILTHGFPATPENVKKLPREIQCDQHLQILPTISMAKLWMISTHRPTQDKCWSKCHQDTTS